MRLPHRHLLFMFFIVNVIFLSFCFVLDFLLVLVKFRRHRSTGNDVFRRSKITRDIRTDGPTDGRTDGRTRPLKIGRKQIFFREKDKGVEGEEE